MKYRTTVVHSQKKSIAYLMVRVPILGCLLVVSSLLVVVHLCTKYNIKMSDTFILYLLTCNVKFQEYTCSSIVSMSSKWL